MHCHSEKKTHKGRTNLKTDFAILLELVQWMDAILVHTQGVYRVGLSIFPQNQNRISNVLNVKNSNNIRIFYVFFKFIIVKY